MERLSKRCSKAIAIGCALLVAGTSMAFIPYNSTLTVEAADYNYAKGLQYSMYLYDANMCGTEVDENSAMDWRGDCHTYDENASTPYGTVDVSGGYHDAGDHVKFGLPQAYSASILGYGYYEFKDAYTQTGQDSHMKTISTYFADYFKRCTILNNDGSVKAFCYQVGDGNSDHLEWCAPEDQTIDRPTYWATSSNPATDIVSNTAGALAFHYKNFGDTEALTYAKALYNFAKSNNKAVATDGVSGFYSSDSYLDDLAWAAAALYEVTGDSSYKSDLDGYINESNYAYTSQWPLCWGSMWPAVNLIRDDWSRIDELMNWYKSQSTTSDGYVANSNWGSARYNTAMQLVGLIYDKETGTNKYSDWAQSQMNYLMGNNNANICYITGFSNNSVTQPHHRAATGYTGFPSENVGVPYANTLIGALVGGPDQSGNFVDDVNSYEYTEVAIDYNAGFVGAMAGLYLKYGSGQSVDSSIEGVSGVKTNPNPSTSTTTTSSTSVTTTPTPNSGGNDVLNKTELEKNTDGTDVLKIYINTTNSDTVTLTLTGGTPGATTSGLVGYWDNNTQSWIENSPWEEQKFDSNGNLTIEGLKVPTNTNDVQIMLTYYANWSTGSENNLDKSSLGVSVTDGSATTVTTAPTNTSQSSTTTTNVPQLSGNNIVTKTDLEKNTDGTDVLKIYINTTNSDTVTLTLTGGTPGATTSGLIGYWDNNTQSWIENSPWEEQKFDSNGNLTIAGLKVPTNTNDVQIMLTYYADWSTGSENNLDKSSLSASVTDGTATTVTTAPTGTSQSTTTSTPSGGNNIVSKTELEKNDDGTDVLKVYVNTTNNDTVTITITGGTPGATTSGEVGYWDNSTQQWIGKVDTWEEQKFDSNGNLTITGVKVPTNTNDVQIMLTYYADWSTGSENNLDKSSLNVSVYDGNNVPSSSGTTTTTTTTVTTVTTVSTTSTPNETLLGDINCDGDVKSNDLLLLKKYLLGLDDLTTQGYANADLNQDGDVKSNDLLQLKKILLGLE